MTQSLHPAAKQGFSASAELYQQVRPDYPAEISQWLSKTLALPGHGRIFWIGQQHRQVYPLFYAPAQ